MRTSLDASDDDGDDAYESDCVYHGMGGPGLLSNWILVCVSLVGISEAGLLEVVFVSGVRGCDSNSGSSSNGGSSTVRRTGREGVRGETVGEL